MPYQLQIVEKPTYLHVIVTGTNTLENVASAKRGSASTYSSRSV